MNLRLRRITSPTLLAFALAIVATSAVGCSSPTSPGATPAAVASSLVLNDAQVFFGGEAVNGQTMSPTQMQGTSTLFRATLRNESGPALGQTVQVQYQRPGMGGMGGPAQGVMRLYDDGTHGDPTAGDGIYCFEDNQAEYGFHHSSPHGQYHYEFFGIDHNDHHSNHMQVQVTIAQETAAASSLQLSSAQVMVNGQVVNGSTMQPGQGNSTFFQATLSDSGGPALGHTVQVQYQRPGMAGMGGMGGPAQGVMHLYDDGTHGDPTPGDGIYCFEDTQGQYGFHHHGSPHGQYHYEFFGIDHNDHHSNHMQVQVTIASG